MTIELPDEAAGLFGDSEPEMSREILVAAVLRWFEEGRLSQGQAATTLGLNRGEFFKLLNARRVSPVQMSVEDLEGDFWRD